MNCFVNTRADRTDDTDKELILKNIEFYIKKVTILFRYFTPYYEAALLSVLLMSFLNSILDRIGSIARFHFEKSIPFFLSLWVLMIGISVFIGTKY